MNKWQANTTSTIDPYFEFTRESDETIAINVAPLLINGGSATNPTSSAADVGTDTTVADLDAPSLAANVLSQRILGSLFTADTLYLFRFTITTSGNVRPITLYGKCLE